MSNTDALSGARDLAWRERPLEGLRVLELGPVKLPGLVPKLSETPGGSSGTAAFSASPPRRSSGFRRKG
jgi:hypothetical protein